MKENIMFQQKDAEMLEAFRKLIVDFRSVSDMFIERFNEMATCWREHRKELLSELDKENEDESGSSEFDYVDKFYATIWDLRDFFQGKPEILLQVLERTEPYLADVETLRKRNLERIAKLKEKQNQK
jgi:DNA-directed RNA polymerase alpha subunit